MPKINRPGMNQNVPTYNELIRLGYCDRYYDSGKPELAKAYEELRTTNPAGYKELMDLDYKQGRRDYVHEDNKDSNLPELEAGYEYEPLSHLFPNTPSGKYLLSIATMLSKGYCQEEISELLGCSQSTVSRKVDEIRVIMGEAAGGEC